MAGGEAQARATDPARGEPYAGSRAFAGASPAAAAPQHAVFRARRALPLVTVTTEDRTRSYAISPVLWLSGGLVAASLALGGIASGLYMAFHDDILEYAINRPIRMEQAYEDRIAALRSEIDRVNSRQLLDQDAFETKIGQLMTRQDELRAQEARVSGLIAKAHDQSIHLANSRDTGSEPVLPTPDLTPAATSPDVTQPGRPTPGATPHPIDDTPLRSSWLFGPGAPRTSGHAAPAVQIARVAAELDRMKTAQLTSIAAVAGLAETHSRAIERVVSRLGLRVSEPDPLPAPKPRPIDVAAATRTTAPERGVGGPLVPILDEAEMLTRAEAAVARLSQLKLGIGLLPVGQPIHGPIEVTSPFGERSDPFLGVLAMHTGIDFRAGYGEPVDVTAAGVVTEASRQGGYGNMVEVDHGNGIATRYGHLSQFAVVVGQKVKAGQTIGYVGSTGRSTAAHLHYETRVSGVAVNPESYLQAGNQLRPLLN